MKQVFYNPWSDAPNAVLEDTNPNKNNANSPLGFPTGAGRFKFDQDPDQAFQVYVNTLGGPDSAMGRFASKRFGSVYADYLKDAMNDPNMVFTDWLDRYSGSGKMQQSYQGASAFSRDPYNTPTWAQTRFLG